MNKDQEREIREDVYKLLDGSQLELIEIGISTNNAQMTTLNFKTSIHNYSDEYPHLSTEEVLNQFRNSSFDDIVENLSQSVIDGLNKAGVYDEVEETEIKIDEEV